MHCINPCAASPVYLGFQASFQPNKMSLFKINEIQQDKLNISFICIDAVILKIDYERRSD